MITNADFLREVLDGMSHELKTLHPKWLYDHRGSELFEEITEVPEYYPTRTEAKIFPRAFEDLKKRPLDVHAVIEYGSGSSKKVGPLLQCLRPDAYYPIDISVDYLYASSSEIQSQYPDIEVHPVVGDFTGEIVLPTSIAPSHQRLGFFPGSTIGNFEPGTAVPFLKRVRDSLGDGAHFLISGDLIKDRATLEAAYDDASGVTSAFNLNLLTRMNRELDANFDISAFAHRSVWNDTHSRVEMHLVSLKDQSVSIGGRTFSFSKGESLHTESSYKYSIDGFEEMAGMASWHLDAYWTDEDDLFGVFLLKG